MVSLDDSGEVEGPGLGNGVEGGSGKGGAKLCDERGAGPFVARGEGAEARGGRVRLELAERGGAPMIMGAPGLTPGGSVEGRGGGDGEGEETEREGKGMGERAETERGEEVDGEEEEE